MTPGAFRARDVSIAMILAWGTGLRQSLACTIPGTMTSLMKRARPVAFSGVSTRFAAVPIILTSGGARDAPPRHPPPLLDVARRREARRADPLHRCALVLGRALARVDGLADVGSGDVFQNRHRARLAIDVDLGSAHAALPEHRGAAERSR